MSHIYVRLVLKTTLPRPKKLVCVAIAHHVDDVGEAQIELDRVRR